jgi:hypothetical protein
MLKRVMKHSLSIYWTAKYSRDNPEFTIPLTRLPDVAGINLMLWMVSLLYDRMDLAEVSVDELLEYIIDAHQSALRDATSVKELFEEFSRRPPGPGLSIVPTDISDEDLEAIVQG